MRKQRDTIDQHGQDEKQVVTASEMSLFMRQKRLPLIGLQRRDHRRTHDNPAPRSRFGERERPSRVHDAHPPGLDAPLGPPQPNSER